VCARIVSVSEVTWLFYPTRFRASYVLTTSSHGTITETTIRSKKLAGSLSLSHFKQQPSNRFILDRDSGEIRVSCGSVQERYKVAVISDGILLTWTEKYRRLTHKHGYLTLDNLFLYDRTYLVILVVYFYHLKWKSLSIFTFRRSMPVTENSISLGFTAEVQ